jgi:transcriptional regulator with XRE-family HTH domain
MQPERELVSSLSLEAGSRLREIRQNQGLTLQRVEELGARIASAHNNQEFAIPMSRLSHIETKGVVPSIYRVYSLARIYRLNPEVIFEWYGIKQPVLDALQLDEAPRGRFAFFKSPRTAPIPTTVDPSFDGRISADVARIIEAWGEVPFSFLTKFRTRQYIYGYVGTEDTMMFPILPPGSFVQVDPERRNVKKAMWRTDYDRPIYAVESRNAMYFCWCSIAERRLVLQPHPLSPAEIKIFHVDEAEILGQVVGAAIRVASSSPAVVPLR